MVWTRGFTLVILIQSLLNAIPSSEGGPQTKLKVDGIIGQLSVAAIRRYQQARTRIVDGRIDPHGQTIKSLMTVLNDRGALPSGLPNIGRLDQNIYNALTGVRMPYMSQPNNPSVMDKNLSMAVNSTPYVHPKLSTYTGPTGWKYEWSRGLDLSLAWGGVCYMEIAMSHDIEPGLTYTFTFIGPGVGLSALPAGADASNNSEPGGGTILYKDAQYGKAPPISAGDLGNRVPAAILSVGANLPIGIGWSVTCSRKVTPKRWRESTRIKTGDFCNEENIYR